MPTSSGPGVPAGPTVPNHLAAACSAFESRWQSGERPEIEEFLQQTRPDDRTTLLTLLVRIDIRERLQRGETPRPEEYLLRFPQDRETLAGLDWSALSGSELARQALADISTMLVSPSRRERVGRFELLERIGVGGFGEVWRAFDPHLQREVAVKIGHFDADEQARATLLLHEARSAGRLRHHGIVPVHEAGVEGRLAYIVSDFIPGATLAERLKAGSLPHREAAEIARKLAEAVAHAHDRGIVHRDIKPANVLLDRAGEPHLTDFGVARRAAGDKTISRDGQPLGTPAYMSPEQAKGDAAAVDHRTDVYALGVVLYEMLAGRRAYPGDAHESIQRILLGPPQRLRLFRNDLPRDLETIVETAIAREPSGRYQTAAALAEDLGRFLRDEPILARRAGPLERSWRWARRRPVTLAAGVAGAVLIGTTGVLGTWPFGPPKTSNAATASGGQTPPDMPGATSAESGGVTGDVVPPNDTRLVEIVAHPDGTSFWLFPRNPETGWVEAERRIPAKPERDFRTRASVSLKPGEYLIVADVGDGRFIEVDRRVPMRNEPIPFAEANTTWFLNADGSIRLEVDVPPARSTEKLVRVPHGVAQVRDGLGRVLEVEMPAFYMAPHEMTVREYLDIKAAHREADGLEVRPRLPHYVRRDLPADYAITLNYPDADAILALAGLRLPDGPEWEYAASLTTVDWQEIADALPTDGKFGPAGTPAADRTGTAPPIFGLRSNVAEWTSTWIVSVPPPRPEAANEPPVGRDRSVRGGGESVWNGSPSVSPNERDVRVQHSVPYGMHYPGIGLRGVRSIKPRRTPEDFPRVLRVLDGPGK